MTSWSQSKKVKDHPKQSGPWTTRIGACQFPYLMAHNEMTWLTLCSATFDSPAQMISWPTGTNQQQDLNSHLWSHSRGLKKPCYHDSKSTSTHIPKTVNSNANSSPTTQQWKLFTNLQTSIGKQQSGNIYLVRATPITHHTILPICPQQIWEVHPDIMHRIIVLPSSHKKVSCTNWHLYKQTIISLLIRGFVEK